MALASDAVHPDVGYRCPRCGHVEWLGKGRMIVAGPDDGAECATSDSHGPEWTCQNCGYGVTAPGAMKENLDAVCVG